MIKKILLTLGITLLSFFGFSYGITINQGLFGTGEIGGNLSYNKNIVGLQVGIDENLNFITSFNGLTRNVFTFYTDSTAFTSFYWGNGIVVNGYTKLFRNSNSRGGILPYAYLCDTVNSSKWNNTNNPTAFENCTQIVNNELIYENYIQNAKVGDEFIYGSIVRSNSDEYYISPFLTINISELDKSITFYYQAFENSCINLIPCYNKSWSSSIPTTITGHYLYDTFPNDLIYIFSGNSSGGLGFDGNIDINDSDIINYFESNGFSENLCFVGTWNLSSNSYEDFKFTKNGNGEHIFNFFRYAYNIGTGEEYKLHYVGNFLNELYQNNYTFKEILHSSGDLIDIFEFNYPTNNYVSWYSALYNDSLYPYLNKPLVYQLYPHQLYYYLPDWDINDRKYDLVEYCYFKLGFNQHRNISGNNQDNYGNAGNLQFSGNSALIQNVSDYLVHMSTYDSRIMTGNFWGSGGSSVNIALDFNDSPIDYFVEQNSSGSYENFDTLTFLNESFNRFKGVFGDLNPSDFGFGYLPGYIITFMLAFILFRFLSH